MKCNCELWQKKEVATGVLTSVIYEGMFNTSNVRPFGLQGCVSVTLCSLIYKWRTTWLVSATFTWITATQTFTTCIFVRRSKLLIMSTAAQCQVCKHSIVCLNCLLMINYCMQNHKIICIGSNYFVQWWGPGVFGGFNPHLSYLIRTNIKCENDEYVLCKHCKQFTNCTFSY